MLFGRSDNRKLWDAVRGLTEGLENLERQMKGLRLDWESTYDKLQRMAQRVAKRAEVVEKAEGAEQETGVDGDAPGAIHSGLTSRQKQVQQTILRRRAGL